MMKRIMIAGFRVLPLIPSLLFPFVKRSSQTDTGENRSLTEFPAFSPDTYEAYPAAASSYINDHAAFRNLFLSMSPMINLKLLGHAGSQDAIVGKDGWYFFAGDMSLYDAPGTQPPYQDDAIWIGGQIIKATGHYESQGIPLLMTIALNKEGIYRGHIPDVYGRLWNRNRPGQLKDYIQEHLDVAVLDLREYFNTSWDYVWYCKADTHWNSAGGYAAGQMLIEVLGGIPVPVEDVQMDYVKGALGNPVNLLHLPEKYYGDQIAPVNGYHEDFKATVQNVNGDKNIVYTSTSGIPDKRQITVIRDPFGTALTDFLPRYFVNVGFYHWQAFDRSFLEGNPPDTMVYLIVEWDLARISQDVGKMVSEE